MQDLYLRLGQGTPLTYAQEDLNFKRIKAAIDSLETAVAGAGTGTVTSVGLTLPNIFTVSGSPVISSGSLTATLASQTANRIFASPNGTSGQPTFRSLVSGDINFAIPVTKGGTGLTSPIANNFILASNAGVYEGREVTVGTGLTLTTGPGSMYFALNLAAINLTSLSGVLGNTNGGTNQNSYTTGDILYASATNTLSKLPIGAAGRVLTVSLGGIPTWAVPTASGVTNINGETGGISFATSTTGSDFTISVPSTSVIQFNLPTASASNRGLLSTTDWSTFNSKASVSGTTNYLTKITGVNTIGNSRVFDNGTNMGFGTASPSTDFHFYTANVTTDLRVEAASSSSIQLYDSSALKLTISSGGTIKTWATGSSLTLTSDASAGGIVIAGTTGNTTIRKGFGISNFGYWNVAGTYTFSSNELYGVILGTGSSNTLNIALPSSPFNGQEICIMTEKSNTITLTSASTIYGHATIAFNIASGTAMCLAKFSTATGIGSWFISSS
jgi:hypothetical protein